MKLWELVSAFREDAAFVREVLQSERWYVPYGRAWELYIQGPKRPAELDEEVPTELSREVAAASRMLFSVDADGTIRRARTGRHLLTALEIHDRYGGSVIEEVSEKGCATAPHRR